MTTIDLTPSWGAILPALVAVIQDGTQEGKTAAMHELRRMARAADRWNEIAPQLVDTLEALERACTDEGVRGMNSLLEKSRAILNTARGQS